MVLLYSSHASCGPELLAVQLLRQGLRFCMTVPTAQHQPPVSVPPRGRTLSAERRIWRLCVLRARLSANGRRPGRPRGKHCSAPFRTDAAPSADRPMHSTHAQDACVGNVDFRKGPGTARLAQTCARAQHQPLPHKSQLGDARASSLSSILALPVWSGLRRSKFPMDRNTLRAELWPRVQSANPLRSISGADRTARHGECRAGRRPWPWNL